LSSIFFPGRDSSTAPSFRACPALNFIECLASEKSFFFPAEKKDFSSPRPTTESSIKWSDEVVEKTRHEEFLIAFEQSLFPGVRAHKAILIASAVCIYYYLNR
jgi:hypothetical protein